MNLPIWITYGLIVREQGLEMQFELSREDYLKLWMYFEDRADKVKEAMFKHSRGQSDMQPRCRASFFSL